MIENIKTIQCNKLFCNSQRKSPFTIIEYSLNYLKEDKTIIDELYTKAIELAKHVYYGGANNSTTLRSKEVVFANCIAGVFSEYYWKYFLNKENIVVNSTSFISASNQIDLEVVASKKKIEVRSSFPRNGVEFALCHPKYQFDILGPYSNNYKPGEIQKDYYVRTLFPMDKPTDIIKSIKSNNFRLYLTGGATWNMMLDEKYSIIKTLVPQDCMVEQKSAYLVVPFSNALDTLEIKRLITN